MQFQKQDIWTRRERSKRLSVWISETWLIENLPGLTEENFRKYYRYEFIKTVSGTKRKKQDILPDTGYEWRYAKKMSGYYYDFDRIPNKITKHIGNKETLLKLYKESLESNVIEALEAELVDYVRDLSPWYKLYSGTCTEAQTKELARAAAIIQYAAAEISNQEPSSNNDYYRNLGSIIERQGWGYLPKNYRRLKDKITAVMEGAKVTDVVKLPRKGNNNRKPYENEKVISWMMYLRARGENYSNAHIARRIIKMCHIARIVVPSKSWIEHFMAKPKTKFLTGSKRYGKDRKGWYYKDYLPIEGALYAGDCWQMDGTRVNFIPHKSTDGKERSLNIIAVRDVHSGDIIGCHFDTKEDRYGYIHALHMAVMETGHLPFELVHDRFPGHNTDEWKLITKRVQREGVKVTVTSTGTGKSHVERCFSTMQDVFMQDVKEYYGHGVRSTRDAAHRSPEYLAKARKKANKEGWDFEAAWQRAVQVVNLYRTTPLCEYSTKNATVQESPKQLYQQSDQLNVHALDDFRRVELFGTMRHVTIRNNGIIKMRIHKAEYTYKIDDYDLISNYKKVNLYYDLEDLGTVYLFAPGEDVNTHFLGEVKEEKAIKYYGPNADMERLGKAKADRKKIREQRDAELADMIEGASDEVALLTSVATAKTDVDDAETRWLNDRVGVWQDRGTDSRVVIPEQENDADDYEQDNEVNQEELLQAVLRNY